MPAMENGGSKTAAFAVWFVPAMETCRNKTAAFAVWFVPAMETCRSKTAAFAVWLVLCPQKLCKNFANCSVLYIKSSG